MSFPESVGLYVAWDEEPDGGLARRVLKDPNLLPLGGQAHFSRLDSTTDIEGVLQRWRYGDVLEPMRYYVHKKVNDRLSGHVSPAVLPFLGGKIRLFPDSLLSALYLRFAFDLSSGGGYSREATCQFCKQVFAQTRRDMKYCSKSCRDKATYWS